MFSFHSHMVNWIGSAIIQLPCSQDTIGNMALPSMSIENSVYLIGYGLKGEDWLCGADAYKSPFETNVLISKRSHPLGALGKQNAGGRQEVWHWSTSLLALRSGGGFLVWVPILEKLWKVSSEGHIFGIGIETLVRNAWVQDPAPV